MFRRLRSTLQGARMVSAMVALVVSSASLIGLAPAPAGTTVEPWIDTSNREAVAVAWALEQGRAVPSMDWTGSHDDCSPGASSRHLAQATIGRVNFYRAMAGVPATVRLDDGFSTKAQHAALTMSATGQLSHAPDDSFVCLDGAAREGAANSNLYLGRTGPSAIDGYIEDPGDRNRDVGHRNTILHPPTTRMGVGHVAGTEGVYPANALWVFDDAVFDPSPSTREGDGFVAWPPRGHVPGELIHPRWSFGLAGADFDNATVTMVAEGESVALDVVTRHSLADYVPSPIIVWEPAAGSRPGLVGDEEPADVTGDLVVDVLIEGVLIDGEVRDFAYEVRIMAPGRPIDTSGVVAGAASLAARLLALPIPGT